MQTQDRQDANEDGIEEKIYERVKAKQDYERTSNAM
jgi:hypothetical protein